MPLSFLSACPKGICCCPYSCSDSHNKTGAPIHRALCDGWDVNRPPGTKPLPLSLPLPFLLSSPKGSTVVFAFCFLGTSGLVAQGFSLGFPCLSTPLKKWGFQPLGYAFLSEPQNQVPHVWSFGRGFQRPIPIDLPSRMTDDYPILHHPALREQERSLR